MPEPRIDYTPFQTVEPTTSAPNDRATSTANPNDFGAQVGQAREQLGQSQIGLGQAIAGVGGDATKIATDIQGIFNEHSANQADMTLAVEGGKVESAYKMHEGFSALQNKDKAVNDYLAINQKIRGSLNPAAARAYDQLANRRMAYTVAGMNDYAVTQTKSALKAGRAASIEMNEDMASRYGVASDDAQFGYQIGSVKHDLNDLLTNPAMGGPLAGLPVQQDKDGTLKFDTSTSEGTSAQAFYNNNLKIELGKIWQNRITAIATDNDHGSYVSAMKMLSDHKSEIPAATYTQLAQKFYPLAQTEKIHNNNENILANANSTFLNQPSSTTDQPEQEVSAAKTVSNLFPGSVITSEQRSVDHNKEVGGVPDSMHLNGQAIDFVAPKGVTLDQVKKGFTDSGFQVTEAIDEGDHIHIGWAPKTSGTGTSTGLSPVTQADYLLMHEPELIEQARSDAKAAGMDSTYQDQAAQAMHTRITEQSSAQNAQARALSDSVIAKVIDPKHPITNMYQLMYGDQATRASWAQAITLNPYLERTVQDLVTANAAGQSKTYGTTPYRVIQDILNQKVTDQSQLGQYGIGGDQAPLSGSGFTAMSKAIDQGQTPQGRAFAQSESTFLSSVHDQLTGANLLPPGAINGAGEKRVNDYMNQLLPQIDATKARLEAAGKNPNEMFDPNSSEYVGRGMKSPSMETLMNESMAASFNDVSDKAGSPAPNKAASQASPETFSNRDDLAKAVKEGKVDRKAAIEYSHQKGWSVPTPQVPKPSL